MRFASRQKRQRRLGRGGGFEGGGRVWVNIKEFKYACGVNDWYILELQICFRFVFFVSKDVGNVLVIQSLA